MNKKLMIGITAVFISAVLVACGGNDDNPPNNDANIEDNSSENMENNGESDPTNETDDPDMDMDPSSSGEVPDDLDEAEDPTYPVDSEAEINADHMEGMDGATAEIDSAEDTTVYMVSYEDTDNENEVTNHKWVIEDELSPVE